MLNLFTLAILAFAAYRGAQFIVFDSLTAPLRYRLEMWHAARHESRWRTFVLDLLSCYFCVGYWLSGIALAAYLTAFDCWAYTSWLAHGIEWWAVAGMQVLMSLAGEKLKS